MRGGGEARRGQEREARVAGAGGAGTAPLPRVLVPALTLSPRSPRVLLPLTPPPRQLHTTPGRAAADGCIVTPAVRGPLGC